MQHPRETIRSVRSGALTVMTSGGRTARATHPGDAPLDALRFRFLGIAGLLTVLTFGLAACADDGEWDDPDAPPPAGEVGERGEDPDRDLTQRGQDYGETTPAGQPMLPDGAVLTFEVMETVSTADSDAGDEVRLRLVEPVPGTNGAELEAGTIATAVITESHESEGPDDEAVLAVHVSTVEVNGSDRALSGTVQSAETEAAARASGQRTVATVATGAAAGAVIGQILGGDTRSTAAGAAAGAAAGLGIALTTRDGHAVLHEGSLITVRLDEPLILP